MTRIQNHFFSAPKSILFILGFLAICLAFSYPIDTDNDILSDGVVMKALNEGGFDDIKKVVIDPGHGGKDHGCSGHNSKEKMIALALAKKMKEKMREYHPEIEVILTRETDVFIPLFKRIDIANKSNADLFISIHCNSFASSRIHGSETYVMGLHTADENLIVAKRENAAILYESDFKTNYSGYDPNSDEGHIILSMFQNAYLDQSIKVANAIEKSFEKRTKFKSRGVKQAGFVVLRQATMPSVLVEAGFLTHKRDEKYLRSEQGQNAIAESLVKGFTEYKRELDRTLTNSSHPVQNTTSTTTTKPTNPPVVHKSAPATKTTASTTKRSIPTTAPSIPTANTSTSKSTTTSTSAPRKYTSTSTASTAHSTPTKRPTKKSTSANRSPSPTTRTVVSSPAIIYRVQLAATAKLIDQTAHKWQQVPDIEIREEKGLYKYITGFFTSKTEATDLRKRMLNVGFDGAFVVRYRGGERI